MIDPKIIEEAKNRLVKVYDPLAIYLFGSYAWGTPDEDSDLDFLVVVEESGEIKYKRSVSGHHALFGLMIPKDIIVYTRDEFGDRANDKGTLCYKIKKEGKRIYESERAKA